MMDFKDLEEILKKQPLRVEEDIPVFSEDDGYIKNYERIAVDHISSMKPESSNPFIEEELWLKLERSTRELITKYANRGDRVLDVGVGLGRTLGPLEQYRRYGIDISLDYLKIARKSGIQVFFSKIEDMPFKDSSFDLIVTTDVFEHVLDLDHCTREVLRVLKPGGKLIVRVPYKEDLSAYLSPDLPYEFVHLRAFDEASLWLHFCKIHGMKLCESATVAPYLQGAPRLKIRLLEDQDRLELKNRIKKFGSEFKLLKKILNYSSEELTTWIYNLKDKNRTAYESVAELLVYGMDINSVFEKK